MPPENACCIFCRARLRAADGPGCVACAEYIARLTDSDDPLVRSYGWQLHNQAYRNRAALGGLARNYRYYMAA